jgi:hypothetical protein
MQDAAECGTLLSVPEHLPSDWVTAAESAVQHAQAVRAFHRKRSRRGSTQREADIQIALDRIKAAMRPLRSEIGRFSYGPQTNTAEHNREMIRKLSRQLQAERRKLWKMKERKEDS